jgi:porin
VVGLAMAQVPSGTPNAGATQPGASTASDQATPGQSSAGEPPAAAPTGFWERSNLLGDLGGLRPFLNDHGVSFALQETTEVLGNFTGGTHRGADYDGVM